MKILNILIFVILSLNLSIACDCVQLGSLTVAALKTYKSIALVKVVEVVDAYQRTNGEDFPAYRIRVKTIEHYKGDTLTEIIVDGGHPKFKTWTSCFFQLNEGEEWLVFTREFEQNKSIVQPCDRNARYRSITGLQYWTYQESPTLVFLNHTYQKTAKFAKKGKHEVFYANGQKEIEEVYKNGKLSGLKKIWYPDGKILSEMNFKRGKLSGITKWYNEKGNLEKLVEYKKGREVYSKMYRFSLTEKGVEASYLDNEIFYDWKKGIATEIYYYLNGQMSNKDQILLKTGTRIGLYYQWDSTGKIIRTGGYDKDGREINIKTY
jgi:antitoxin component YwqK of YwqJK toxin-antitoxin module